MSVAARLREIDQVLPTNEDVFSGDTKQAAYDALRNALPLLADLAEAARCEYVVRWNEEPCAVAIAEQAMGPENICAICAALARVADQLDHEEGT